MKKIRRILSAVLVLAALFSCAAPGAFAASSKDTVKKLGRKDAEGNGGLLVFGDSISRGCGCAPAGQEDRYKMFEYRNVINSYPLLLAQALDCTMPDGFNPSTDFDGEDDPNFWPVCYPGQSIHLTMKWLGWSDPDDAWEQKIEQAIMNNTLFKDIYFKEAFDAQFGGAENVIKAVNRASVIVVEHGMSDVFIRAAAPAVNVLTDTGTVAEIAGVLIEGLYEGYVHWKEEYPVFIQKLREINPTAQIVMLGAFNPIEGLRISEDSFVDVGNAASAITYSMNKDMQTWYKSFAARDKNISFVDISNAETLICKGDWDIGMIPLDGDVMVSIHPDAEGYAYIYRQILSALPDDPEIADPVCPLEPIINVLNNDIKLDLGRFDHVNYVLLDGKEAKYSMNNPNNPFELTVHCNKRTAKNLTIAVIQEDGNIALYTYQLSYKNGEYSAYRLYSTNNSVKTAATLLKSITNVGSTILKAFAGLFGKK